MIVDNKYDIGEMVYLITDPDQLKRLVTGIEVTQRDILYYVALGSDNVKVYDFEVSREKQIVENG